MGSSVGGFKQAIEQEVPEHLAAVYASLFDCWLTSNEVATQVDIRSSLAKFYCSRLAKLGILDESRALGGARYRVSKNAAAHQPKLVELIHQEAIGEQLIF